MTTPYALLFGLVLIALAIYLKPDARPEYQLESFAPSVVARMDTASGAIDLCGRVEAVIDTAQLLGSMTGQGAPPNDVVIPMLLEEARKTRCFSLNDGAKKRPK